MSAEHISRREPLIRLTKRSGLPVWRAWLIRIAAILLSLVVCAAVIFIITKLNPIEVYKAMFEGAFGTNRRIWSTAKDTVILLCISLAITPAFKMKFWNIGAEGQVLAGGIATAAVMIYFGDKLPSALLFIIMAAASILAGLVWGIIPAFFKAHWNTNETLFTLMMNYIAIQFASYFMIVWEALPGSGKVGVINSRTEAGWIPTDFLSDIFGRFNFSINVIIVLALTVFMFIYLKYSKHGYEISVVGESENTAKYVGIDIKKVIIRTMALSGAVCGVAGFLVVGGASHTISTETAGGYGFTAIIVAWMSKFNSFTMIGVSLLLIFLQKGAIQISTQFGLNEAASEILTGIILFFILGCEFFINYQIKFRKNKEAIK